jgi:hypothetical protein
MAAFYARLLPAWLVVAGVLVVGEMITGPSTRGDEPPAAPTETRPTETSPVESTLSVETTSAESRLPDSEAPVTPAKSKEPPPHFIVLRLSSAMLEQQINRDIDVQRPVRDVIVGTPVSGVARISGTLRANLVPSDNSACMNVVFRGRVHSRTTGRQSPVTIYGRTITDFTASKEIAFEPGKGFYARPMKLAATTQYVTEGIQPDRGGIVGRIIERKASEQVAAKHSAVTAQVRQRATARISARFEEFTNEFLEKMNRAVDMQTRLAMLRQGDGARKLFARTTPECVEIADAVFRDQQPVTPLRLPPSADNGSPIEFWVHHTLVPPGIAQALKVVFSPPDQNGLASALAAFPGPLGKEASAAITVLANDSKFNLQDEGEWTVVELRPAPKEPTAVAIRTPAASRTPAVRRTVTAAASGAVRR